MLKNNTAKTNTNLKIHNFKNHQSGGWFFAQALSKKQEWGVIIIMEGRKENKYHQFLEP